MEEERLNFEIITIPMMKDGTKSDISDQFSREVPWLVLQNPGKLKSVIKFFLVEVCAEWLREFDYEGLEWDRWHPGTMRVIERDETIAGHNPAVLRMVNTWGAKAYPYTEEKRVECFFFHKKKHPFAIYSNKSKEIIHMTVKTV